MDEKDLHKKLDKIGLDVNEIKITQAVHTAQMEEHMRRTHLIETRQEKFEIKMEKDIDSINGRIKPVSEHMHNLRGAWKLILAIGSLAAIVYTVSKLL